MLPSSSVSVGIRFDNASRYVLASLLNTAAWYALPSKIADSLSWSLVGAELNGARGYSEAAKVWIDLRSAEQFGKSLLDSMSKTAGALVLNRALLTGIRLEGQTG